MKRKNFIRSFIALCAAPSAIAYVDKGIVSSNPIPKTKFKRAVYFKVANQMLEDENAMLFFLEEQARCGSIDLSKPYKLVIGYENTDFERNLQTCIMTQYFEKSTA